MPTFLTLLGAFVLFLIGLRLSAFFSGAETGFYRISLLRLSIDADRGDERARTLSWFARHPGHFVATTLVGNNLANYLTTLAIGVGSAALLGSAEWVEIVGTLMATPVVFVFGELLPKNLFYRSPMSLLRAATPWFRLCYRLLLPLAMPLVALAKLFERLSGATSRADALLGRRRLIHALSQGHQHGLLTDAQDRLAHGVLEAASLSVRDAMTPPARAFGIDEDATCEAALDYAGRFGSPQLVVKRKDDERWIGYVRVVELAVTGKPPIDVLRPLPEIDANASKLDALAVLHEAGESRGVVCDDDRQIGIVSQQGLSEQLFRSTNVLGQSA